MTVTVSLRITSPESPVEPIVSSLGLEPSRASSKGYPRTDPKGNPLKGTWDKSFAVFPLHRNERVFLGEILANCERVLSSRAGALKAIRDAGGTTELFIGWFLERSGGDTLSSDLLSALAKLGLDLSFDIYPADAESDQA